KRAVDAVSYNLVQIAAKGTDWSNWGATYEFINNHNQAFIDENLDPATIANQRLNFLLFYNAKGKLVESLGADVETQEGMDVPSSLTSILTPSSSLLVNDLKDTEGKQGILMLPEGPLMLVT